MQCCDLPRTDWVRAGGIGPSPDALVLRPISPDIWTARFQVAQAAHRCWTDMGVHFPSEEQQVTKGPLKLLISAHNLSNASCSSSKLTCKLQNPRLDSEQGVWSRHLQLGLAAGLQQQGSIRLNVAGAVPRYAYSPAVQAGPASLQEGGGFRAMPRISCCSAGRRAPLPLSCDDPMLTSPTFDCGVHRIENLIGCES